MIDFVSDFTSGNMSRMFFDLDYSGYVVEHFPKMERESVTIAQLFADTIDSAYDFCAGKANMTEDECREAMKQALDEFLLHVNR